jgi:hypothetical protein
MSSTKIIDLYRDFAASVHLAEVQSYISLKHCIHVYSIHIHIGKRWDVGRVEPVRRL